MKSVLIDVIMAEQAMFDLDKPRIKGESRMRSTRRSDEERHRILTRLKLKDFRQYRGEHQLTFAHDESHNVTVITGMNGTGKTGLFYALNWCLYGDAQALPGSLINKAALQEEAFPTAVVELHFLHEGARYVCRREQVRTPNGSEREGSFTLQQLEAGGRVVDLKNAPERVNVILPRDARRYFFFDGERIDELARPGHEAEVKEAVRSVLKLKVLSVRPSILTRPLRTTPRPCAARAN